MSGGTQRPPGGGGSNKTSASKPVKPKPVQAASGGTQKPKDKRA